jgi:hypothetical protein
VIVEVGERELQRWHGPREVLRYFEARWLEEEDCATKVEEAWSSALLDGTTTLLELKSQVLGELWEWDRLVLGELEKRVKNARSELERCRRWGISQENVNREHVLRYKLERLGISCMCSGNNVLTIFGCCKEIGILNFSMPVHQRGGGKMG